MMFGSDVFSDRLLDRGDRLVDRIAELLRDGIVEERYAPGQPLPRRPLAEQLNTGPTVVGEALRVLGREGLVVLGPRGETRVAVPRRPLLLDAYEVRSVVDGLAARLAAEQNGSLGREFEKTLEEQRAASEAGDPRRFVRADIAFHAALLIRSGNVFVRSAVPLVRWTCRAVPSDDSAMRRALAAHEAILDAVRAHNPDEAESAARSHIREVVGLVTRDLAGSTNGDRRREP
jgi:DNA-binding GntR family transcriptional regulator